MTLFDQKLRIPGLAAALVALVAGPLGSGLVLAQGADLAAQELKAAFEISQKHLKEVEAKAAQLDAKNRALAESLAESNRLLDSLRADHEELMLRMASFGVDLLKPEPNSLEQRLLNTVRERELVEQEKEKLATRLFRLSEASMNYLQSAVSPDAASRALLERELQAATQLLGTGAEPAKAKSRTLGEGRVVSIDPEIGLVVLNVGRKCGVRVGMPLRILRKDNLIGTAMVVDVRDAITGAVLQQIAVDGNDVKVGDRIEPESQQL